MKHHNGCRRNAQRNQAPSKGLEVTNQSRNLEERDHFEDYLNQFEGSRLSEDDENSDDEYRDAEEIRIIMVFLIITRNKNDTELNM
ncbi:hypothetical protein TNCV_1011151 [Trichonephila clavipes]|uniref:Uncharacterized protein n=1 Tax=Trichonephila clavipes TaxID=2585209 RepID=A0A8X7BAW1_TRICX|nr:hypothetical protein TNCV_1011151 [Trichonephila clavipes]